MFFVIALFAIIFIGAPLAAAAGRRWEKEAGRPDPASLAEISRLRDEVERLSGEVLRLQEEQSFMVKLLGDAERKRLLEGPANEG